MTIEELRPYQDAIVTLYLRDGEIATVRLVFVDAEYDDIIVDVVQSNRRYFGPANAAYAIPAADVMSIHPLPG